MSVKRVLLHAIAITTLVAVWPNAPGQASIVGKTIMHLQCSEFDRVALPKKITMMQVINDASFGSAPYLGVQMFASYPFRFDVNNGLVVARGVVVKPDGERVSLPKMSARMRRGDADQMKSTNTRIERGDIIEWKIKLKNLAPLAELADCFTIQVGIVCSETLPITSSLAVASTVVSKKISKKK